MGASHFGALIFFRLISLLCVYVYIFIGMHIFCVNPLTPIAVAFETTPSNYNMLVYFFCTLFQFVCCIKCNAGGRRPAGIAFYAADKLKKRAEKVNKHIII